MPFVLAQMLSPLLRFSVPVQFTPYNSLKVFDISKHTGPGVADVAGPRPQRQLLYQPVRSMGGLHWQGAKDRCSGAICLLWL